MHPKRILLLGSYGQDNIGDKFMLETLVKNFGKFKYKIAVNSSNPQKTIKDFNIDAFSTKLLADVRKKIVLLLKADLIIFGGGTIFIEHVDYFGRKNIRPIIITLSVLIIAKILGKKVCMFAIGIGKLEKIISKILTAFSLSLCSLTIVRDKYSYKIARKLSKKKVFLGVDMIFIHKSINNTSLNNKLTNTIGITPCYWVRGDQSYRKRFVNTFIQVVSKLRSQYESKKVRFIPFQSRWGKYNDYWLSKNILKNVLNNKRMEIKVYNSPMETLKAFQGLEIFIGVRLHSIIFSIINTIPFIAISYQKKVSAMVSELGLNELIIEVDEFNWSNMKSKFENIFKNRNKYVTKLKTIRSVNHKKALIMFNKLNNWIKQN